ncbi:MAG TPA: ECF-type sigma factor [Pyrinomonadaceae bacterium]|nr:ECF-type sigma factor [Pyrinomonadaceae bacterium]
MGINVNDLGLRQASHSPLLESGFRELLDLDAALTKLSMCDERRSKIVEYRYFGGFTMPEIADILGVSVTTVEREWKIARSWLLREIRSSTSRDC